MGREIVLKTNEMEKKIHFFNMPTTKTGHCKTSKLQHLDLCHAVQHEHKLNPFCSGYGKAINNNIDI